MNLARQLIHGFDLPARLVIDVLIGAGAVDGRPGNRPHVAWVGTAS